MTASHYLFIFSLFSIVLSVLRITASDYLFKYRQYNGKEGKDKEIIRSRNSKYRQYNGKEIKDKEVIRSRNSKYRQYNGKERKDKEVINGFSLPLWSFLSFPLYCLYLDLRLMITSLSFLSFPLYCLSVILSTDNTMEKREKIKR
jgi:hypothetical protein